MKLEVAHNILTHLSSSIHHKLYIDFVKKAVRYSRLRVDWQVSSIEERREMDEERTRAHNAFISACDILSRNMAEAGEDHSWRTVIGQDRKDIGDFACLVHAVLGIMAR